MHVIDKKLVKYGEKWEWVGKVDVGLVYCENYLRVVVEWVDVENVWVEVKGVELNKEGYWG